MAATTGTGLANYNGSGTDITGPLRVGFAATSTTNRTGAGSGYYGVMELTGNCEEQIVTLGTSNGRSFTGTHGDGTLTSTASYEGNATNNDWPGIDATTARGVTGATGSGYRGGSWGDSAALNAIGYRGNASSGITTRTRWRSGRFVRTAP